MYRLCRASCPFFRLVTLFVRIMAPALEGQRIALSLHHRERRSFNHQHSNAQPPGGSRGLYIGTRFVCGGLLRGAQGQEILRAFNGILQAAQELLQIVASFDEINLRGVDHQ